MPIEEIYDFIRAWTFDDRPLPYFNFKGKKILVSLETNNIN